MSAKKPAVKITRDELLKKYDYENICSLWCKADHWSLNDAINLLLGLKPTFFGNEEIDSKTELNRDLLHQIALNCLGESLPATNNSEQDDKPHIRPHEFLEWAETRYHPIPSPLLEAINEATNQFKRGLQKSLKPTQVHRERSRAVAAMLWEKNPKLTKIEMAMRPEILNIGCENRKYSRTTIEDWIKKENPNREPGRRPSK